MALLFVGDDWAQDHHDVHLMGEDGQRLAGGRLPEGLAGLARFHELVADHAQDPAQVVIGIETDHGLWVQGLVAAGYQVYSINPLAAARYRDRHHLSGAKSDAADAKLLADLVRTDRHNHTTVATDSSSVEGIKVLARAHQSLIWARTRHANQLRDALREYFPAALIAFQDLTKRDVELRTRTRPRSSRTNKSLVSCEGPDDNATSKPAPNRFKTVCALNRWLPLLPSPKLLHLLPQLVSPSSRR
jgi:transposase